MYSAYAEALPGWQKAGFVYTPINLPSFMFTAVFVLFKVHNV